MGTALAADPEGLWREHLDRRWHAEGDGEVHLDVAAFLRDRRAVVRFVHDLLTRTASRTPQFGCFGMHEWAMVYHVPEGGRRHEDWPLRLGSAGTDEVVESQRVACSHFDAFRFFTDDAKPRNALQPARSRVLELEQPGCLHATMDLYRWAGHLGPATSSDLLLACFDLAREVRVLDMQASPYDLSALGYRPVPVETADGRAEYARRQRRLSERAAPLRDRLVEVCERLLATGARLSETTLHM